jgi:hypothetical protein
MNGESEHEVKKELQEHIHNL